MESHTQEFVAVDSSKGIIKLWTPQYYILQVNRTLGKAANDFVYLFILLNISSWKHGLYAFMKWDQDVQVGTIMTKVKAFQSIVH